MSTSGVFGEVDRLATAGGDVYIHRLESLEKRGLGRMDRLPYSIRILLESVLRNQNGFSVLEEHVEALANWRPEGAGEREIPFQCARVVLQDFTGVPALVDLAAMRSALQRMKADPRKINPLIPVDLVIDHSVQVDFYAQPNALGLNARLEFERNRERYEFLRWGQTAFDNFRVVPPATGIVHQVNLEYLAKVVIRRSFNGRDVALPDTLVGTDSHTTMINGLGVLGWGVGGIEAEAAMLGQPMYMLIPKVVGFRLTGRLREGATATDLVLRVTQMLRSHGVVDKFVEFFGDGLATLSLPDRATIGNMAPEYGATIGFFPVDDQTLRYLRLTGRSPKEIDLVERYCKAQGVFCTSGSPAPTYSESLELDLADVEPSLAGPRRPQDRIPLSEMQKQWRLDLAAVFGKNSPDPRRPGHSTLQALKAATGLLTAEPEEAGVPVELNGRKSFLAHGSVVIAAITSCTNTSNPSVMLAAGLLARKAADRGLQPPAHVKTSLAPGSRVVTDYLDRAGLTQSLSALGFETVGYGCTTCIGNSGPLPDPVAEAVQREDLVVAAVLSGNRNFEARIHPLVRANYLASPPLVVAYALAGTTDIDFETDPIGFDSSDAPVYLRDIWPSQAEIQSAVEQFVKPEMFARRYADVFTGDEQWQRIKVSGGQVYEWRESSTYIQEPPFFIDLPPAPPPIAPIHGLRVLALLGDSVTTDHISPAGSIKPDSPAGRFLQQLGVTPTEFNSYGSRRGNDRVMTRGTFANVRIRNRLVPDVEGGFTLHFPTGKTMSIFDAAMAYREVRTPLLVIAGKDYGMGSSRDWAAKGTALLGVRAVLAESYERIHRSNLVGMGVLPLQFHAGASAASLGLTGHETFAFPDLSDGLKPGQDVTVQYTTPDGKAGEFKVRCRIDTPVEIEYYRNGGVLQTVLRRVAR